MSITEDIKDIKLECLKIVCSLFQAEEVRTTENVLIDAQKMYAWIKEKQDIKEENCS